MSLLIAGFEYKNMALFEDSEVEPEVTGTFILADSAITSNNKTLLNEFRKIYGLEARLWRPSFLNMRFNRYKTVYKRNAVVLGFAGNTLTSQHILNNIEFHLNWLYISCTDSDDVRYMVRMPCDETNPLFETTTQWSESAFLDTDFGSLLSGDDISNVIAHAIRGALSSAKKYKLCEAEFDSLKTEWAACMYCPVTRQHKLYRFDIAWDEELVCNVKVSEISANKVITLGLSGFQGEAQEIVRHCYRAASSPLGELRAFLGQKITESLAECSKYIDFPIFEMGVRNGTTWENRVDQP